MSVFLITYDLNKPVQDYDKILGIIKRYDFVFLCKSSYVVETDDLPKLNEEILGAIDESTYVYIFPINDPICLMYGHNDEGNGWLTSHLPRRR
jgi:hypothetical protein